MESFSSTGADTIEAPGTSLADKGEAAAIRAAGRIRELVLQRVLVPGEQLRQEDIAASLGVSRGPVREALRILAAEGLLSYVRNRGYFVAQFTKREMRQLYRIRELLESDIVRSLPRASPDYILELRTLNEQHRRKDISLTEILSLNEVFHARLLSSSELKIMIYEAEQVGHRSLAYQAMSINLLNNWDLLADDHEAMISALERHDLELLCRLGVAHRQRSLHRVMPLLRD